MAAEATTISMNKLCAPRPAPRQTPTKIVANELDKLLERYAEMNVHAEKRGVALPFGVSGHVQVHAPGANALASAVASR